MKNLIRLLLPAASLLIPVIALADYSLIQQTVESVGGGLPTAPLIGACSGSTGCGFVVVAEYVVDQFRPGLTIVGVIVLVIFGYRMIVSQEDDTITKARGVISGTIGGLVMVWLIDPFIHAFYGSGGEVPQSEGGILQGVSIVSMEVEGLINWVLVIVASLAVMMIILTTLKSIGQGAKEESAGAIRKTAVSVVLGLVLLVFRFVLSGGFVESTGNPAPILATMLEPISFVMSFFALAAVIVVVYAGFQCVLNMGNEENFTKAKSLLIRALIGMLLIMTSLAIVNFVVLPGVQ